MRIDDPRATRVEPLTVDEAGDADAPEWQRYVFAHPRATFFHRFEWRRLIEDLITLACATDRRNLSWEEWQRYFADQPYRRTCAQWSAGK